MSKQSIEGFLSNPFFVALKISQNDSKWIKKGLSNSITKEYIQDNDYPYQMILKKYKSFHKTQIDDFNKFKNDYLLLVKEALLEYLIEEECVDYFLDNGEIEKFNNIYKRKQFNAKLIKVVFDRIADFMEWTGSMQDNNLSLILDRSITKKIKEFKNNFVIKKFGDFKKIVDEVVSGVKTECYLEFEKGFSDFKSRELEDYILSKHGYNYSSQMNSSEFLYLNEDANDDMVLSLAVINDEKFWIFGFVGPKTLLSFAHLVVKHNGIKHAEKLVDYAFEQACKNPICKYLYDQKLPLYLCYNPLSRMRKLCIQRLKNRFDSITTKKIETSEYDGLLYPLYNGFESQVQEGKEIFINFIKKAYPKDSNIIFGIFNNVENIIQDSDHKRKRTLSLKTMLESEYFGYDERSNLPKFIYGYYKSFGSQESILGRMYYRCYIIKKLAGDITNECLYEIFFDILNMIDFKYHTTCFYKMNQDLRNQNYFLLKELLKNYDFQINDCNKSNYIIALLDRKYASFEEVEIFPQLEQFGDAIYELAVDNILFYNPETTLNHSNQEALVKAEAQIKVSQKIGLNKLYISELHHSLNSKYLDYEIYDTGLQDSRGLFGNYIADSLEMIIGALGLEFGLEKALNFTTKIILESNPQLKEPQIEQFDFVSLSNSNIDKEYLKKIFPSPFEDDYYGDYYTEYQTLWYTIKKLLKICIIGNETKEKRQEISYDAVLCFEALEKCYKYVVSYLYYGIEETIEKFKPIVESSYIEKSL
ncbi:MAG: hypothetical protein K2I42_06200 [Anaeroplasmataceae bacterium]|nr:hypothetical protein [Anaeroplasmataceae bacterium]